jgi:hypothetical protein
MCSEDEGGSESTVQAAVVGIDATTGRYTPVWDQSFLDLVTAWLAFRGHSRSWANASDQATASARRGKYDR